jgi:hypothetical protein
MSSSLYSNKKLAVIRETLCNAWDAHIETGCTDIAVEVTLTADKLIIRDFGYGIHPSKIVPIYGTYGGSTKAANADVTGGFGLGCKAPFAIVDHFEVTSFHKGTKTIYNMALSSAEVAGKPGIQTLVTLPTDETGLQVSLDLPTSHYSFDILIRRVAAAGEMKIKLNGELLKVLPFSKAQDGFLIVDKVFVEEFASKIHVRYGNVVYPVPSHEDYAQSYVEAEKIVGKIGSRWRGDNGNKHLILMAAPNTISVTPSRETLEMTDQTIAAIKDLLIAFNRGFRINYRTKAIDVASESIDRVWINSAPVALFNTEIKIPNLRDKRGEPLSNKKVLTEFTDISRQHLTYNYPEEPEFSKRELRLRLDALIRGGLDTTGRIAKFRRDLIKNGGQAPKGWFVRNIVWPLTRSMAQRPLLDPAQLFVWTGRADYSRQSLAALHSAKSFTIPTTRAYLPYLRPLVILAFNRTDVQSRAKHFPVARHWLGDAGESLVYITPRNPAKVEAARELFTKRGYQIIDLTVWHSWETQPEKIVRGAAPKKKKASGLALLSNILVGTQLKSELAYTDTAVRSDRPDFYVQVAARTNNIDLFGGQDATMAVVRLFGKQGGIISNESQAAKLVAAGIPHLNTWLWAKLKDEFLTNKLIQEFYSYSLVHMADNLIGGIVFNSSYTRNNEDELAAMVLGDTELRKHFGLPDELPQREQDLITIWEANKDWRHKATVAERDEIRAHLKTIKPTPKAAGLFSKISNNPLTSLLKTTHINGALRGPDSARVRKLILHILEG